MIGSKLAPISHWMWHLRKDSSAYEATQRGDPNRLPWVVRVAHPRLGRAILFQSQGDVNVPSTTMSLVSSGTVPLPFDLAESPLHLLSQSHYLICQFTG